MSVPKIGLVCSGGGARGAYEAGVIRYLREEMPDSVKPHIRFDVLAGTSVGAMTSCVLASTMHMPDEQGKRLANLWTNLNFEKVYRVDGESTFTVFRKLVEKTRNSSTPGGWKLYDLIHPEPIERLVRDQIDWPAIAANLARGKFDAISVSTTRIRDGKTVVFVQRRSNSTLSWSTDPYNEAQEVVLGPEHALASSAIPVLFRSVKIGLEYFCDGFVRQNTPLSPALRLGADRVLILSLRHKPNVAPEAPMLHHAPGLPMVLGRVLNALMVDRTDSDLDRLRRFNALLETGRRTFGDDFVGKMNATIREMRGQPYRVVQDLVVRPSRDLAEMARPHLEARARKHADDALPSRLLHRLTGSNLFSQADLGSYLLFDGAYARDLIELGMADAHMRREQLLAFFDPSGPAIPPKA